MRCKGSDPGRKALHCVNTQTPVNLEALLQNLLNIWD